MSDNQNPLDRFTRRASYPALVKPTSRPQIEPVETDDDTEEGSGYRALIEHREKKGGTPRFRIIDHKGVSYGCGYAYLLGWVYTPPDTLAIYTTTHSFVLTGRYLQHIENALMRERVRQLREFAKGKDELPAPDQPIIDTLTITSRIS